MHEFLKKRASKQLSKAADFELVDEKFAAECPVLFGLVTANHDGEGELCQRCKIQVFAESGSWKACIMDPETEHSLFITLRTPSDVFKALEKALGVDRPDWRKWRQGKKK